MTMQPKVMIDLAVVHHYFPIPRLLAKIERAHGDPGIKSVFADCSSEWRQAWRERIGVSVEIDENKALPHFMPDLRQPNLLGLESGCALHFRSTAKPTIQLVSPCMVGTNEYLAMTTD